MEGKATLNPLAQQYHFSTCPISRGHFLPIPRLKMLEFKVTDGPNARYPDCADLGSGR